MEPASLASPSLPSTSSSPVHGYLSFEEDLDVDPPSPTPQMFNECPSGLMILLMQLDLWLEILQILVALMLKLLGLVY